MQDITYEQAQRMADRYNVDTHIISVKQLQAAMTKEMVVTSKAPKELALMEYIPSDGESSEEQELNILARIVLRHLLQNPGGHGYPNYYQHVQRTEEDAEKYWDKERELGFNKPPIFKKEFSHQKTLSDLIGKEGRFYR